MAKVNKVVANYLKNYAFELDKVKEILK